MGLRLIDIAIITTIEILLALIFAALLKFLLFRTTQHAFKHIFKYGLVGIFIAFIFGQILASTFTDDKYIINAGRLLVVQLPTYSMILGLITGTIILFRRTRRR